MKAIPTKYAGVQFRSRLEARWAAFFELVGWTWAYEPIDLAGYIPDFVVSVDDKGTGREPMLIEVKPIIEWPCAVPACLCGAQTPSLRDSHDEAIAKIQSSGWTKHALIVGAVLLPPGQQGVPRIGQPIESQAGSGDWFDTPCVVCRCRSCSSYLWVPDIEGWGTCCDCQFRDGSGNNKPAIAVDPTTLWREAGNRAQWRGRSA